MAIQLGGLAPNFTLDHVLGHSVSLSDYRGKRVVVVFGGTGSASQLKEGIMTIRRSIGPDQVAIVTVSDLSAAPRPARRIVKGKLKKVYDDAVTEAAGLSPGTDPDIIMLTDWDGAVAENYGLNADEQAVGVAIDEQGQIIGYGAGAELGQQILGVLGAS